jgi:hypothetical protein
MRIQIFLVGMLYLATNSIALAAGDETGIWGIFSTSDQSNHLMVVNFKVKF